jgi:hypothetical protein
MKELNKLPDTNPESLEECLQILARYKYKSLGFPLIFFEPFINGTWGISYRNPMHFSNPEIRSKTPLGACHEMMDFLRTLQ